MSNEADDLESPNTQTELLTGVPKDKDADGPTAVVSKDIMKYNEKQTDPLDTLLTINLLFKGNQTKSGPEI